MDAPRVGKTVIFDLDQTLCDRPKNIEHLGIVKYKQCFPIPEMIEKCNELYKLGHEIVIWTSRGMTTLNGDLLAIELRLRHLTERHLSEWGVKYHRLQFGKPHYDLFVCDKTFNPLNNDVSGITDMI